MAVASQLRPPPSLHELCRNSTDWLEFSRSWYVWLYLLVRCDADFGQEHSGPPILTAPCLRCFAGPYESTARLLYNLPDICLGPRAGDVLCVPCFPQQMAVLTRSIRKGITQKLRGYGFVFQMMQLPIIAVQRTEFMRKSPTFNNVMFWFSIIYGLATVSPSAIEDRTVTNGMGADQRTVRLDLTSFFSHTFGFKSVYIHIALISTFPERLVRYYSTCFITASDSILVEYRYCGGEEFPLFVSSH